MNENEDGFAWINRYTQPLPNPERRTAYARYNRTLAWLADWEVRPDSGYYRLWHDIVIGGEDA